MRPGRKSTSRPKRRRSGGPAGLSPVMLVFLLLSAVAIGLLLPELSAAVQERRTDRLSRTAELGQVSLSLTSDDAKLEKLAIVGNMMNDRGDAISLESGGRFMTAAQASDKFDQVLALLEGTDLDVGGLTQIDVLSSHAMLLVSDFGSVSTDLVWFVDAGKFVEDCWNGLQYIVDDATGMILAAEYYQVDNERLTAGEQPDKTETARRIMENLEESYAFTDTVLSLGISTAVDRSSTAYYVSYTNSKGEVLGFPIIIGEDGWSINAYQGM